MFNIGDLMILEIAILQFMETLDLSVEAGRQCSSTLGKLEAAIAQQSAIAQSHIPNVNVSPAPAPAPAQAPQPEFKPV